MFEQGKVLHQEEVYDFARFNQEEFIRTKTGADNRNLVCDLDSEENVTSRALDNICDDIPFTKSITSSLPPIQDQFECTVCHIFAGIAALESRIAIKYGRRPVKLSEQEIFQCVIRTCSSGNPDSVWFRAWQNKGLSPSTAYSPFNYDVPYFQECSDPLPISPNTKVIGIGMIIRNEAALKCHVATKGAAAILIPAVFNNYKSGVFADPSNDCKKRDAYKLNHWMVVVGYGTTFDKKLQPIDYWILRNSWGKADDDFTFLTLID